MTARTTLLAAACASAALADAATRASPLLRGADGAAPKPPCYVAQNPEFETLCYTEVFNNGKVSVRSFVGDFAWVTSPAAKGDVYQEAFNLGAYGVFAYLGGYNSQAKQLPRTAPLVLRPPSAGKPVEYRTSMAIATSAYPDPAKLPKPYANASTFMAIEPFAGEHLLAVRAFDTDDYPQPSDYEAACAALEADLASVKGFTLLRNSTWTPTHAYWQTRDAPTDSGECWVQVQRA